MQHLSVRFQDPDPRDLAACRRLLANGSRTFFAASFLLPRRVREPATALYAFCRLADDAIDLGGADPGILDRLTDRLDRAYRGNPSDHPADRAFAAVVASHNIPRALPGALIEGFAWDAESRRYETMADLEDYAARVAGTVGTMMAVLMGVRDSNLLARACDLGIAMQLTNIARDVGEDARAGRLYLPLSWMREAGLDPDAWLARPVFNRQIASVIDRLLASADQLYRRSESGIAGLPSDCRPGIAAARYLYAEIGHVLMRQGYDSITSRAVVPATRKLQLLATALHSSRLSAAHVHAAPIQGAAYLVAAASSAGPRAEPNPVLPPWWNVYGRLGRMVEILERLERREREVLERNRPVPRVAETVNA